MRCEFGTDQSTSKKRPAVVVSSAAYHRERLDVVVMAISGQAAVSGRGDLPVSGWQQAGLLRPSFVKPVFATIEQRLVVKKLGELGDHDRAALELTLRTLLAP